MTEVPAELARLRARVTAVEARLENEAGLRAMVDMDQSAITTRLDAQQKLLRALARTQSDHTAQLREHGMQLREQGERLERVSYRLNQVDDRLERVEAGIGRVEVGVHAILGLLGGADGSTGPGSAEP
jgi:chromosome segregation ATPase